MSVRSAGRVHPNECVRAVQMFHSTDPRFLSFEKNDLIEITHVNNDGTLM
ncbi:unnamed protein product, partial [Anisakis simplex]|uniref:SH3 domain-containing protein n=1 Tax=Anisakis simplex TaxID=6269 RepID=A0A0M3JI97_ANISI